MILLCRCANADVLPVSTLEPVRRWLAESGRAVAAVDDLCGLAARGDERLKALAAAGEAVVVLACHARAVRWLLHRAGVELPPDRLTVLNMRTQSPEEIISILSGMNATGDSVLFEKTQASSEGKTCAKTQASMETEGSICSLAFSRTLEKTGDTDPGKWDDPWIPWFPVIDLDRCIHCKQCLNFCLFGVYALDEGSKVRVRNPRKCKTNCPACARLCPEVAIMFPKYAEGPISGREVRPEDLARRDLRVDPRGMSRGDVLAALKERSRR